MANSLIRVGLDSKGWAAERLVGGSRTTGSGGRLGMLGQWDICHACFRAE